MNPADLWALAPVTPPGIRANTTLYQCTDCDDWHETSDQTDVLLAHIVRLGGVPWVADRDLLNKVLNPSCIGEITAAYQQLLQRRLAVPGWFVEAMDLDLLVKAWVQVLDLLVHPQTGEFLGLSSDQERFEMMDPTPIYYNDAFCSPLDLWGTGPISLGVWCPLQLFYVDTAAGETWRLDAGWIGGERAGWVLERPYPSLEQPMSTGGPESRPTGPPIQAALDARDPIPLVTRHHVQRLEAAGRPWELAWSEKVMPG